MVSERLNYTFLEPFRHPAYPFLYVVEDEMVIKDIIGMFEKNLYGLETGFGNEPTRVFQINDNLPWLITEPDKRWFGYFKNEMERHWMDLDFNLIPIKHPIIAVNSYSTYELQKKAQNLVYRNLDYRDMYMVKYDELRKGQRVTFIVNSLHTSEMQNYHYFLREYGYNPDLLLLRDKSIPPLTQTCPFAPDEYVLDVTK
jgi:hypothetical protein